MQANSTAAAPIIKGIGVVLQDLDVLLGIDCSPITGVGVGGGSGSTVVCCDSTAPVCSLSF